ncbi:unnamed protein product [Closterium sp. Naga37s-1]|nr:unnamed protein product [Closterium sp. Naga37s-1]
MGCSQRPSASPSGRASSPRRSSAVAIRHGTGASTSPRGPPRLSLCCPLRVCPVQHAQGWVFPVVWINLYIMMGVAAWLVWLQGGFSVQALPLGIYLFQLLLNFLWTPLFFGMRKIDWALAEIVLLWLSVFSTIVLFWPVSKLASILLWPYIVWASIATSLNWYIFLHNAPTPGADGLAQPLRASD